MARVLPTPAVAADAAAVTELVFALESSLYEKELADAPVA
jgi:hypothetical protein